MKKWPNVHNKMNQAENTEEYQEYIKKQTLVILNCSIRGRRIILLAIEPPPALHLPVWKMHLAIPMLHARQPLPNIPSPI